MDGRTLHAVRPDRRKIACPGPRFELWRTRARRRRSALRRLSLEVSHQLRCVVRRVALGVAQHLPIGVQFPHIRRELRPTDVQMGNSDRAAYAALTAAFSNEV